MIRASLARAETRGEQALANGIGFLCLLVATVATLALLIPLDPRWPASGLDASWTYALNEAVADHRAFGREFIFSFGPLGSAYTGVFHPATDHLMLCAAAVIASGLMCGLVLLAPRRKRWFVLALPLVIAIAELRDGVFMLPPLLLVLVAQDFSQASNAGARHRYEPLRGALLVVLVCACGVLPLVKGSFGVMAVVGVALAAGLSAAYGRWFIAAGIPSIATLSTAAGWVIAGQSLRELAHFPVSQLDIISGYSEAMSAHGSLGEIAFFAVPALAALGLFFLGRTWGEGRRGTLTLLAIAAYLFLAFKAGFVRQDGHERISAIALLLLAVVGGVVLPVRVALLFGVIAVTGWFGIEVSAGGFDAATAAQRARGAFESTLRGVALRTTSPDPLPGLFARAKADLRAASPLPATTGSADVYPSDLAPLFAAGIEWAGRPVPQSYSAYLPALATKNASHLRGPDAPGTVFVSIAPIDDRLALLEDAPSWPILLSDYTVEDRAGNALRLAHRSSSDFAEVVALGATDARIGEPVAVPESVLPIRARIDLHPTLVGRVVLALFRLPQVQIELTLENASVISRRYIPAMGSDGFLLSPLVDSTDDLLMLAAGVDHGTRVRSIRLLTRAAGLWDPALRIDFASLALPHQPGAQRLLSIATASPPPALADVTAFGVAGCSVDALNGIAPGAAGSEIAVSHSLSLSGWSAPSPETGIGPEQNWIVLTAADSSRRYFRAPLVPRADVNAAFHRPELQASGFQLVLDLEGLRGRQQLDIVSVRDDRAWQCHVATTLVLP